MQNNTSTPAARHTLKAARVRRGRVRQQYPAAATQHYRHQRIAPDLQASRADFAAAAKLKAAWFSWRTGLTWRGTGAIMAGSYVMPWQASFTGAVQHTPGYPSRYEFSLPTDSSYRTAWLYVDARSGLPTDTPGLYRPSHPLNQGHQAATAYIAAYTATNTQRYRLPQGAMPLPLAG